MKKEFCKRSSIERIFRNYEGVEALCCKMLSDFPIGSTEINQFQKQLQKGAKLDICNICWKKENEGLQSWRQQGNKLYNTTDIFKKIEIIFDNTCDSKCIYCSRLYSSSWDQEIKNSTIEVPEYALGLHAKSTKENNSEKILEYIKQIGKQSPLDLATHLILLGGEPLLTTINKKGMLEVCIEKFYEETTNDKRLVVIIQTNCNTPENILQKIISKLKEYKQKYPKLRIDISASGESVGKNYEYVRYGSSYDRFVKNIYTWTQEGFYVSSNMSINCVSLIDLKKYFELFVEMAKKNDTYTYLNPNLVFHPPHLSIAILDQSFEKHINEAMSYIENNSKYVENSKQIIEDLKEYKKYLGTDTLEVDNTKRTLEYFKLQRNVDIKDVNLELYEYLYKK